MTDRPMAVVFSLVDGSTHEMWVPPGFAITMQNGGILVIREDYMVSTLVSVRPLGGEASDAAEVQQHEDSPEDRVDEPGRDTDGLVPDPEAGDGRAAGEGAAEGARVPGGADGSGPAPIDCPYGCDCHDDPYGDQCEDCRIGSCTPWPEYAVRAPGPDDAPGITV